MTALSVISCHLRLDDDVCYRVFCRLLFVFSSSKLILLRRMDEIAALRNFKDFLMIYNQMAELCFNRCVSTVNSRTLLPEEEQCVDKCAAKHISINHKMMSIYMEVQPQIIQKRNEDLQKEMISSQESQVSSSKLESTETIAASDSEAPKIASDGTTIDDTSVQTETPQT